MVELARGQGLEMALRDLDGFDRIWLVFVFDRNMGAWRPTTRPPVAAPGRRRVGLFASRAPYRPNPIGLSCVRLISISGLTLHVADSDLLDGTPILDVKPYIPAADAFPEAHAGWVDEQCSEAWHVEAAPSFMSAFEAVRAAGAPDILRAATLQLSRDPFDSSRKRVSATSEGGTLSLRMFRIVFSSDPCTRTITLLRLESGYTMEELAAMDDPYADKAFHRALMENARSKP